MTKLRKTSKRTSLGFCVLDFPRSSPNVCFGFRYSAFGFFLLACFASLREIIRFGCGYAALILFATGCDPVLNIGGTFFPGWMVAILIGSTLTVVIRYVFVFTRLEPHVGPLALIYTSLGLLLSVVSWLILYRS
jgi:YtcA family